MCVHVCWIILRPYVWLNGGWWHFLWTSIFLQQPCQLLQSKAVLIKLVRNHNRSAFFCLPPPALCVCWVDLLHKMDESNRGWRSLSYLCWFLFPLLVFDLDLLLVNTSWQSVWKTLCNWARIIVRQQNTTRLQLWRYAVLQRFLLKLVCCIISFVSYFLESLQCSICPQSNMSVKK